MSPQVTVLSTSPRKHSSIVFRNCDKMSIFEECNLPMTLIDIDLSEVERQILNSEYDLAGNLKSSFVTEQICYTVAKLARDIFKKESSLIEVDRPVFVIGDIHGQFRDLMRIIDALGYPPTDKVLFLGDYVDRGQFSLEVIVTLLLMKIRYPDKVQILRGNHEVSKVNKRYGFKNECQTRFNHLNVYNILNRVFDYLPVAAIIDNSFFCCHGGISEILIKQQPGIDNLKRVINGIRRPFSTLAHRDLETDLLWSDPMDDFADSTSSDSQQHDSPPAQGSHQTLQQQMSPQQKQPQQSRATKPVFTASSRGIGFKFNAEATNVFVKRNSLKAVIRAHQVMKLGLSVQHNMQCITVFSAPGYFNNRNYGAVAYLLRPDEGKELDLCDSIRVLQFSPRNASNQKIT